MATKLKAGAKAPTVKAKATTTKKTATKAASAAKTVLSAGAKLVGAVKAKAGGKITAKGGKLGAHRKTAKQRLKAAYDRRAMRNIRIGNLGQARRDLRKKATVV